MSESDRPHPLSDSIIAECWPDADNPGGRAEIRRQFDALMHQVRTSFAKPFPRQPEVMAPIVIEKARPLSERLEIVKAALAGLPAHWRQWQWIADKKQAFGDRYVRSAIVGDNGHGFGRQWIACVNHVAKEYVGTLADFIAAANPDTVAMMVARIEELEAMVDKAIKLRIEDMTDIYRFAQDNDGHWYVIPEADADDWEQWLRDGDEDEPPEFAVAVGGHPALVKFRDFEIE